MNNFIKYLIILINYMEKEINTLNTSTDVSDQSESISENNFTKKIDK